MSVSRLHATPRHAWTTLCAFTRNTCTIQVDHDPIYLVTVCSYYCCRCLSPAQYSSYMNCNRAYAFMFDLIAYLKKRCLPVFGLLFTQKSMPICMFTPLVNLHKQTNSKLDCRAREKHVNRNQTFAMCG